MQSNGRALELTLQSHLVRFRGRVDDPKKREASSAHLLRRRRCNCRLVFLALTLALAAGYPHDEV